MHSAAPPLRLHHRDLKAGAAVLALVAILTVFHLGDVLMRRSRAGLAALIAGLALTAVLALTACATSATDLVKAANDLDPGCYKNIRVDMVPMFGFVVPIGHYEKTCNPDQARPVQRVTIVPALPAVPGPPGPDQ